MTAKIKRWYYWEDGMGPFFRLRSVHKWLLIILVAVAYVSFFVFDFGSRPMKLFGTTVLFGAILLIGFTGKLFYNTTAIWASGGRFPVIGMIFNLWLGGMIGWVITPLYLVLAIADIRYCMKVKKSHPEFMPQKEKAVHTNLTKKEN